MKNLKEYIKEGLFDGIDDIENTNGLDNATKGFKQLDKEKIIDWIKENYNCIELKISDNTNKNGLYEVTAHIVKVKNKNITSLTNGMFEWVKAKSFDCSNCTSLKSLKGAPKEVGRSFYCYECPSLISLEGAPEKVGGHFDCCECINIKSLKGAPEKVGRDFHCYKCKINFTVDDVKKVSDVRGEIYVK